MKSPLPVQIVLLAGALATPWVAHEARRQERLEVRRHAERLADDFLIDLSGEVSSTLEIVRSIQAFYDSSTLVEQHEFQSFTTPFTEAHEKIQALEWVAVVRERERAAFEGQVGHEGLRITERDDQGDLVAAGHRPLYYPVTFVTPLAGNERALGFDLGSDPTRLEALENARDTGKLHATRRVSLVHEDGTSSGVLILGPVFRMGGSAEKPVERREALLGFALGVFDLEDMLAGILSNDSYRRARMRVSLLDELASGEEQRLFDSDPEVRLAPEDEELSLDRPFEVAGRRWRLLCAPDPALLGVVGQDRFWGTCVAGSLLTLLLAAYLRALLNRSALVEAQVEQRTTELAEAKRLLEERGRELERVNQELIEKNRDLDEFVHVASHDLQEPLRKIVSFSTLLEKDLGDDLSEQVSEDIGFLTGATRRMKALIETLLEFSRAGRKELTQEAVALEDCVDQALDALRVRIEETGAQVVRRPLPAVLGDGGVLTQVFQNLIGNALKFQRPGEVPRVTVAAEDEGDWIRVSVTDNGIGIDIEPGQADTVFAPFKRLHGSSEYEGTGLGLAICRKIVARHGGEIGVESEPGVGCTFHFTLPAAGASAALSRAA